MIYWIAVGSNIHAQESVLKGAKLIARVMNRLQTSYCYWNPAIGRPDQSDYLNAVWRGESHYSKVDLKAQLRKIEAQCGRVRDPRDSYKARTLDLDIIGSDGVFYDQEEIEKRSFLSQGIVDLRAKGKTPRVEFKDLRRDVAMTDRIREIWVDDSVQKKGEKE